MPLCLRWSLRGMMVVVAIAAVLLLAVRWSLPRVSVSYRIWLKNSQIQAQLDQILPLAYPDGVPLGDLHRTLALATRSLDLPRGIPIYVDQAGLDDAHKTMGTLVVFDGRNVPLGQSLRSALRNYGLDYFVEDGLMTITSRAEQAR